MWTKTKEQLCYRLFDDFELMDNQPLFHKCMLDMRSQKVNEAHSTQLAVVISYPASMGGAMFWFKVALNSFQPLYFDGSL